MHRHLIVWAVMGVALFVLFTVANNRPNPSSTIAYSAFLAQVKAKQIKEVTLQGKKIIGIYNDNRAFHTMAPEDPMLIDELLQSGVRVRAESPEKGNLLTSLLSSWLPVLLIVGVFFFLMHQMQSSGNRAMGFGRVRARNPAENESKTTFADVAGVEECKEEMQEIVEFLRDPKKFSALGGEMPRGVLLMGSPGTGKTLMARAIAGEADAPFFNISGSDFVEMFVGVGASRVRDLFGQAKRSAPCILFIDEIDAVGRRRGAGVGGGNDEREQTLNQLLVEMDGFQPNEGLIVIAATNRPDVLDPALLRPGRFDRRLVVPLPDQRGREAILKVHSKQVRLSKKVKLSVVARGCPGFSGADLANLVNEAALLSARRGKKQVSQAAFDEARDKVLMGPERRTLSMPDEVRRVTAYHEAGHAILASLIPEVDPVHKVTIVPRGRALGVTQLLPTEDRQSYSRAQILGQIAMMMGGRAAEEIMFKHFTTGASDDIHKATQLAKRMVMQWGMSENIGPVSYGTDSDDVFLGWDLMRHVGFSQATAYSIDEEVKSVLSSCYTRAKTLIKAHSKALGKIAEILLERETVEGEEVLRLTQEVANA